jgi:hypothetical protein
VQWDERVVRILDPATGTLLREHERQHLGQYTDHPDAGPAHAGSITRSGHLGTPGQFLLHAATFCIAATDSTLINVTTGLPGPGALLLPSQVSARAASARRTATGSKSSTVHTFTNEYE